MRRLWRFALLPMVFALLPMAANAQGAPLQYGQRIPSRIPGWYAPVASNLIGSDEKDHLGRGSVNAWDWSTALGSPVFAIGPGVVNYAGCNDAGHYGCWVRIDHGSGYESSSAHCAEGSIRVRNAQQVDASTHICNIGRTGWTSWDHVHLVIKKDGVHQKISSFFDVRLVHYCFWTRCRASNDPNAPVANGVVQPGQQPTVTGQPSATGAVQTRYAQLLRILAQYPPQVISLGIMGLLGLLVLVYWLGGKVERIAIIAGVSGMAGAAVIVWLFIPLSTPVQAGQPSTVSGSATWKVAYAFMRRWEGGQNPPCVHDPVRTWKGITNGTYNAWRMSQGMGAGDVCRDLTEQQAEAIYYQRYWVASGADRLSPAVAIAHFDHAVNAGVGAAKGVLAQCGDNIDCYIKGRLADYRTKKNYPQYGRAWTNRVNDLVKFLQKGEL